MATCYKSALALMSLARVVLLAWCEDTADPQHAISAEALDLLL
jgi:hypothetical protein